MQEVLELPSRQCLLPPRCQYCCSCPSYHQIYSRLPSMLPSLPLQPPPHCQCLGAYTEAALQHLSGRVWAGTQVSRACTALFRGAAKHLCHTTFLPTFPRLQILSLSVPNLCISDGCAAHILNSLPCESSLMHINLSGYALFGSTGASEALQAVPK